MSRFAVPDYSAITISEAVAIQEQLRAQVVREDNFGPIRTVAGVDIGLDLRTSTARAAVVVLRLPELTVEEQVVATRPITFPYVPGLLGFREVPAALDALSQLRVLPDLLLCDGQGIAHPRRFGLACHLGLLADLPAIGAAKSRLIGTHRPVADERGDWQPLYDGGEMIGVALRTRQRANPLYISPGHRISLSSAIEYVLRCTTTYRLPEPARRAHQLASGSR
jgi:deoxyribonuclease V